jgi:hypothetical protein
MIALEQIQYQEESLVGARYQTFQRSFQEICAGEDPWISLGKFMHQFFGEYQDSRPLLLNDPLLLSENITPNQFRWAVFCAASVEYLCNMYDLSCPTWALDTTYVLDQPWYQGLGSEHEHVQERLRLTTPEEFARRNIFCGNRVYRNKYEDRHGRKKIA